MQIAINSAGKKHVTIHPHENLVGEINPEVPYTWQIDSPDDLDNVLLRFQDTHNVESISTLTGEGQITTIYTVGGRLLGTYIPAWSDDNQEEQIFKVARRREQTSPLSEVANTISSGDLSIFNSAGNTPTTTSSPTQKPSQDQLSNDELQIVKLIHALAREINPAFVDLDTQAQERIARKLSKTISAKVNRGINKVERTSTRDKRAAIRREHFIEKWSQRTGLDPQDPIWDGTDTSRLGSITAWTQWALSSYDVIGEAAQPYVDRGLERVIDGATAVKDFVIEHPREIAVSAVATAVLAGGLAPTISANSPSFSANGKVRIEKSIAPQQKVFELTLAVDKDKNISDIAELFGTTPEKITELNPQITTTTIPAGKQIKIHAPVSTVTLTEPTQVAKIANAFDLPTETVAVLNGVTSEQDVISGEVQLLGRIGLTSQGYPAIDKSAQTTNKANLKPAEQNDLLSEVTLSSPTPTAPTAPTVPETTTTTTPAQVPVSAQVQRVNDILANIKLGQANDLTELTEAVKAMYTAYAPNDPHRRGDIPPGYIKLMLPNEAHGLAVNYTVAERTANIERYTAPEMFAAFLAQAKLYEELVDSKYPQFKGSMLRVRDANSPNHKTHNGGLMLDVSSQMNPFVTQYSDGPFSDTLFSPNYSEDFTAALLIEMSRFTTRGVPTFQRVITSIGSLKDKVNSSAGKRFMALDEGHDHLEHVHYILNNAFELPTFYLRARDLPWGTEQDLRIGKMAVGIDPAILQQEHLPFNEWLENEIKRTAQEPNVPAPTETPSHEVPEANPAPALNPDAPTVKDNGHVVPQGGYLPALNANQLPEKARSIGVKQLETTKTNGVWEVYEQIEQQTGIPAEYMFAIHYREGSNSPTQSMWAGEKLGGVNPDTGKVMGNDLLNNGLKAAKHFKKMAKHVYNIDVTANMTPDQLALAFLAYNRGGGYKINAQKAIGHEMDPLSSPYPMNLYLSDEEMSFPTQGAFTKGAGLDWGEPESVQGRVNHSVGALAMVSIAGGFDHFHERAMQTNQTPQSQTSEPLGR